MAATATDVQTKYDQAVPFVQKIVNSKTEKDKKTAVHGMIEMLAQNERPGVGRGQGLPGAGRGGPSKSGGNHVVGMPVKGKQIGPDMIQAVRDEGGCIGHANGNYIFGPRCKFPHLSDSVHLLCATVYHKGGGGAKAVSCCFGS